MRQSLYVSIGGIDQWIEICGEAAGQPTLLFLHGGPGGPSWPAAKAWKEWEKHFTVVHWDQRDAGRTIGKNGEAGCGRLSIGRMVEGGRGGAGGGGRRGGGAGRRRGGRAGG